MDRYNVISIVVAALVSLLGGKWLGTLGRRKK